eukprot:NODE_569_length_2304_cov_82.684548_g541_i0.p1 GENE.NODE_569_length_2304_cov_82.684548_g541_i0~~NODE_569_length_2304_cov_82.684548_g541_i0.p1  ORF type:complete len:697 (-),score=149.80 NODE_569_length_2304_cov_82.684548_g541_i0:114-2204(-)
MVDASGHFDEEQWLQATLELAGLKRGPRLAPPVAEGLCTTDMIRYLGLRGNNLGDEGIQTIVEGLKVNRSLEILDLSDNRISDTGAVLLANCLKANPTVQSLILSDNKIRGVGGEALAEGLMGNRRLRKLNLSSNKLRDKGAIALGLALTSGNATLQHLNLARNEINVGGGRGLAAMLTENTSLIALNLSKNLIGGGIVEFGPALTHNTVLMELDVECNMITEEDARLFGDGLYQVSLRTINLSNNKIGDDGAKPILDSFKEQSALRYMDLSNVGITYKTMDEVAHLLRLCPCLETLQVDGNPIGCEGVTLLAATVKENQSLTSLNLDRCQMDQQATIALALAMHSNPLFASLTVSGNQINDEGCRSLCYALKRMTLMRTLDLSANQITEAMKEDLAAIFVNNAQLSQIDLQHNPIASKLTNGILSRREARRTLDSMADQSTVLVAPTPLDRTTIRKGAYLPPVRAGSPSVVGSTWGSAASPSLSPMPSKSALLQMTMATPKSSLFHADARNATLLASTMHGGMADDEPTHTYPPLIPPKNSLENPYYPGFGVGTFTNGNLVQSYGELPYTIRNSQGPKPIQKWCNSIPTSETLFATGLRRVHRKSPYSEGQLESNVGSLLVTERQLRQAFAELDVDGNGWLDKNEFTQLFKTFENFGVRPSESQVNETLDRYKMMDDGKITFDEFSLLMLTVAHR